MDSESKPPQHYSFHVFNVHKNSVFIWLISTESLIILGDCIVSTMPPHAYHNHVQEISIFRSTIKKGIGMPWKCLMNLLYSLYVICFRWAAADKWLLSSNHRIGEWPTHWRTLGQSQCSTISKYIILVIFNVYTNNK